MTFRPELVNALTTYLSNPFLVLELSPDSTRETVERQGAKLLAMLLAEVPGADRYPTPFGPRARTSEMVRQALADVRDPDRRLTHEWWAVGFRPS